MKEKGIKAIYSLAKKGYNLGELLSIYNELKNKGINEDEITEELLLHELEKQKYHITKVIDRDRYNLYYSKRYDFTHPKYGLVYPISKIDEEGKISIILENNEIVKVDYQTLTPVVEPSKLHRMMFQTIIPKYFSQSGRIDREGIYDILRIYGEDSKLLSSLGIILEPIYNDEVLKIINKRHYKNKSKETETSLYPKAKNITEDLKVGLDNIQEDISNDEPIKNIRESIGEKETKNNPIIPKYICINGSLSQKAVDRLVVKLEEDLTLLELIGIIPNPNYRGSSKTNSTNKK